MDHVMGLFRLYWVPVGAEAADGAYVRYVWPDLVALLRLEAWRAGAYVVGEDLGTVEDHVRQVLGEQRACCPTRSCGLSPTRRPPGHTRPWAR